MGDRRAPAIVSCHANDAAEGAQREGQLLAQGRRAVRQADDSAAK